MSHSVNRRAPSRIPLGCVLVWCALIGLSRAQSVEELTALMQRCGSEVTWHQTWDEARDAASAKQGYVLVVHQTQAGYQLPDAARLGPFMNEDVLAAVEESFAVFEYAAGRDAPFVSPDVYGVGPSSFGASMLVVDLDGNVLDTTGAFGSLDSFLVRNVARLEPSTPSGSTLDRVRAWMRRGELEAAEHALFGEEGPEADAIRGDIHRRRRQPLEALAFYRSAQAMNEEVDASLAAKEASMLMGLEQRAAARRCLESLPAGLPEVEFLLATLDAAAGDMVSAATRWRSVVQADPEQRAAWMSAAMLLYGPLMEKAGSFDELAGPSPEALSFEQPVRFEPLAVEEFDFAVATAKDYLLSKQRPDGSWLCAMTSDRDAMREPLTLATTAWSGMALIRQEDARSRRAVAKAATFLEASRARLAAEGEPFGAMDYFNWSKPTLLLFGAAGIEAGALDEDVWLPLLNEEVEALAAKQRDGGGWCYYQGTDLNNLEEKLEISFSFVTAYVLLALDAAANAGVDVPDEMVTKAVRCLKTCVQSDGGTVYSLVHANEQAPQGLTPSGSAGRGPLCHLALERWGEGTLDDVRAALVRFVKHRAAYSRQRGKTLMHCGPEGEGSHYLLFDYAWSSAAYAALEPAQQRSFRRPLLELLLTSRTDTGGFVDNPLIGDRFGTAAGLWALSHLGGGE